MGELFGLINTVVDLLKHFQWYGISLWFVIQFILVVDILLIPVVSFFFQKLSGGE